MPPAETATNHGESNTPQHVDEDQEMVDKTTDGTKAKEPGQAAKRARLTSAGESTVSRLVPPPRETSPLRKNQPAPQSAWAHGHTVLAPMPERCRKWLEQNANRMPYNPEYDEIAYAPIPAGRHENPHLWLTQREPRPELPLEGHERFTPGPFPYIHVNFWRHFGNLHPAQKAMLEENLSRWLAIIPHGGGRAVNEHAPELCVAIEEIIWTFRFAGYSGESIKASIMAADPRNVAGPNGTNDFAPPWSLFLDLEHDEKGLLRDFLLSQQHFAFDRSRSFSVHTLDPDHPRSWKTVLLVSRHIALPSASHSDVVNARAAIRQAVIARLATSEDFCVLIAQLAAYRIGHTGTREQIFQSFTDTFHLELTTVDCSDGPPSPAFVLLARPIVDSQSELEALKHAIIVALCGRKSSRDDDHFYVGTRKVRVVDDAKPHPPFHVDCKLCKSELHRTPDCPLPKSAGWRGVQPKDLGYPAEAEKPKATVPARALLEGVFDRLSAGQRGNGKDRGRGGAKRGRGRGGQGSGSRNVTTTRR